MNAASRAVESPARILGLSDAEVQERRERGLINQTSADGGRSLARILSANVFTVFNGVVGGSFVLLLVLGAWQDALFGFSVVANTVIGVVQEFRAKRTLDRLAVLSAPNASVRREGRSVQCAVADIVLDDVLVLSAGDQVSADAELVDARDMEVDESLLTGESARVHCPTGRVLLSGSTVTAGSGLARVIRIGNDSYAARITSEARRFSLVRSELRRAIGRIIRWLSVGLFPIGAIVINGQIQAAGGWEVALSTGTWRDAAVTSVGSIIAMVPAGLVFMTSVAFAVGASRLARDRVLVRELAAVEGLARVDIICIDKTGTLTEGMMALDRVEPIELPVAGWQHALASLAASPVANATTRAIAVDFRVDHSGTAPDDFITFASRHKWSAAHFDGRMARGSWVLGGADVVLNESAADASVLARVAELAERGERALVLAHSPTTWPIASEHESPRLPDALEAVAVLVFREKLRADAVDTMGYFTRQGVEVCVISGDDPRTVASVAREVGLPVDQRSVDARTLPSLPSELADVLRVNRVFGRVTPEQKKAMVIALQSLGHTVAMIGDGVNDTLALKHADLGIAMGSGSAAARAVAQVVLLEGELSQLPGVVAEGRRVIGNIERLAKLFLTKTVYAIVLAVTFGLLLWPFPFLPRQLSIVDGLTIGLPALILGLIANSAIDRPGFLRRAARFCVPSGLILAVVVFAIVTYSSADAGTTPAQVRTVAVITLTLSALWVLVVLARPFTRLTGAVVVSAYLALVLLVLAPVSADFLEFELPPTHVLLVAIGLSVVACVLIELVSRVRGTAGRALG